MKRFLLILLFVTSLSFAQNNGITYQAIIYNPDGEELPGVNNPYAPIFNQSICLQFGIVDADGNLEYQEQANVITDDFGMVNLIIGTYPQSAGYASSFSEIQWSSDSKFLVVDLDIRGSCTDFVEISNQPLSYVPFALYAENSSADENIDALTALVEQIETDSNAAIATLQADVDQNEADSDTTDTVLQAQIDANETAANNAIDALQADVDQNEADSDTTDAVLQAQIDTNETAANNAIDALQADVDQNEADSDTTDAALQAQIDNNETAANNAIDALQADVDQNEADSDTTDAVLQAQIDANETAANIAIDALQADVDQNEADSDTTDAALQTDVDQNEEDSDAADTALQLELDTTQSGSGLQDDGSYVANTSMNYINESTSIVDATEDLDAAIAALQESNAALQALIEDLQSQVDNLTNTGTYTPTLISGSGTFTEANWFQIGDMVIVIGNFNNGDLTDGTEIIIDTPTTNTFSSSTDVSGNVAGFMMNMESVGGSVRALQGTNRVVFSGAGAHGIAFDMDGGYVFSYNLGGGTTYTPTTNGNITLSPANYSINGSTVIVNGNFSDGDFGFFSEDNIEISIPTSSTFSNAYDATGVVSSTVMMGFESGAGHVEAVPNSSSVKISLSGAHGIAFEADGSYTFTYNTSSAGGLTYNPSVTEGSATISNVQYFKYGDMVIVSGLIDNASSGTVISIPISSFFTSPYDVKGLVTGSDFDESAAGIIQSVPNSENVQISFRGAHGQTNCDQGSFIFTYKL